MKATRSARLLLTRPGLGPPARLLILAVLLPLAALGADEPAPAASTGDLLQDLALLRVVSRLELTPRQAGKIAALLREVQVDFAAVESVRQRALKSRAEDFRTVCDAYLKGEEPPRECLERINAALAEVHAAEEGAEAKLARHETRLIGYLTRDQAARLETEQEYQAALKRREQLEGAASAAEYVVAQARAVRDLLPEEYQAQAGPLAERIALVIEGPRSRRLVAVRERVRYLFEQVRAMSQKEFDAALPTMPEQVSKLLDLPPEPTAPTDRVGRQEFLEFLKSPRTIELLTELQSSAPEETPE